MRLYLLNLMLCFFPFVKECVLSLSRVYCVLNRTKKERPRSVTAFMSSSQGQTLTRSLIYSCDHNKKRHIKAKGNAECCSDSRLGRFCFHTNVCTLPRSLFLVFERRIAFFLFRIYSGDLDKSMSLPLLSVENIKESPEWSRLKKSTASYIVLRVKGIVHLK